MSCDVTFLHVGLTVADFDRTAEFYEKYFGFKKTLDSRFNADFFTRYKKVDLPAPFLPTRAMRSRSFTTKLTFLNNGFALNSTESPSIDIIFSFLILLFL